MLGNCFAAYSKVSGEVRAADKPSKHGRSSRSTKRAAEETFWQCCTRQQQKQQPTGQSVEQVVQQAASTKSGMADSSVLPSAKRSHTPPPIPSQISPQQDAQMNEKQAPDDAMEINALCDEEIRLIWKRSSTKLASSTTTIPGRFWNVMRREQESRPSSGVRTVRVEAKLGETVQRKREGEIHQLRDGSQGQRQRSAVANCGLGVRAHTPFASHDVSVAFFYAWLEQGVGVKPPNELRLGDEWLLVGGENALRHRFLTWCEACTSRTNGLCCRRCRVSRSAASSNDLR